MRLISFLDRFGAEGLCVCLFQSSEQKENQERRKRNRVQLGRNALGELALDFVRALSDPDALVSGRDENEAIAAVEGLDGDVDFDGSRVDRQRPSHVKQSRIVTHLDFFVRAFALFVCVDFALAVWLCGLP